MQNVYMLEYPQLSYVYERCGGRKKYLFISGIIL